MVVVKPIIKNIIRSKMYKWKKYNWKFTISEIDEIKTEIAKTVGDYGMGITNKMIKQWGREILNELKFEDKIIKVSSKESKDIYKKARIMHEVRSLKQMLNEIERNLDNINYILDMHKYITKQLRNI
ncbi:MAG: hypothetical protein ACTSX6_00230 [Candidatus Heimdallarchaeaceae archaeon]